MAEVITSQRIHHEQAIRGIVTIPTTHGYRIITGGDDWTLYTCSPDLQHTLSYVNTSGPVTSLAALPDGSILGTDTEVGPFMYERLFFPDHEEYFLEEEDDAPHKSLCVLSDTLYAAIHPHSGISVIDAGEPEEIAFTIAEDALFISSQKGGRFVALNRLGQLVEWDALTLQSVRGLEGHMRLQNVCHMVALKNRRVAIVNEAHSSTVQVLTLPYNGEVPYRTFDCEDTITCLYAANSYILVGTIQGKVVIYHLPSQTLTQFICHDSPVTASALSPITVSHQGTCLESSVSRHWLITKHLKTPSYIL